MRLLRALVAATSGGSACTKSTRLPGYLWLPDADDESFPLFSVDIYRGLFFGDDPLGGSGTRREK